MKIDGTQLLKTLEPFTKNVCAFVRLSDEDSQKLFVVGTATIVCGGSSEPFLLTARHVREKLMAYVTGAHSDPLALSVLHTLSEDKQRDLLTVVPPDDFAVFEGKECYRRTWPTPIPKVNDVVYVLGCPARLVAREAGSARDNILRLVVVPARVSVVSSDEDFVMISCDGFELVNCPRSAAEIEIALADFGGMSGGAVFVDRGGHLFLCGVYGGASAAETPYAAFSRIDGVGPDGKMGAIV